MQWLRNEQGIVGEILLVLIAIGVVVFVFGKVYTIRHAAANIKDFEGCAKLYPVQESYPEVCRTPDGRSFVHYN